MDVDCVTMICILLSTKNHKLSKYIKHYKLTSSDYFCKQNNAATTLDLYHNNLSGLTISLKNLGGRPMRLLYIILVSHVAYSTVKYPEKMLVNVAIADLQNEPKKAPSLAQLATSQRKKPLLSSQLLLGDQIIAHKEWTDTNLTKWLHVTANQQIICSSKSKCSGFPGWIQAEQATSVPTYPNNNLVVKNLSAPLFDIDGNIIDTLCMGTNLAGKKVKNTKCWKVTLPDTSNAYINDCDIVALSLNSHKSEEQLRQSIVATAQQWIGIDYCFGGRSFQDIDCSALINLVFAAHGLQIPRNSKSQYLQSQKIKYGKNLQAGDLVFFCPETTSLQQKNQDIVCSMTHVMMYIGDGNLLEATHSGNCNVRIISFEERIGISHKKMNSGDVSLKATTAGKIANQYHVFFGSLLK